MTYFDALETRSQDAREAAQLAALNSILEQEGTAPLPDVAALAGLEVFRKSELAGRQEETPPFGGLTVRHVAHVFQSPGPIYE
ncbi:MAG: phenylacetate--CoA ligase family protein, partial [Pseudomonadota bacterium]